MAASEVTPIVLGRAAGSNLSTAAQVTFDSSTGFYIDAFDSTQNNLGGRFIILFGGDSDAFDTSPKVMIRTSTNKAFTGSGMADLQIGLSTNDGSFASTLDDQITIVGPLETARFVDTAGHINVSFATTAELGAANDTLAKALYATVIVIP